MLKWFMDLISETYFGSLSHGNVEEKDDSRTLSWIGFGFFHKHSINRKGLESLMAVSPTQTTEWSEWSMRNKGPKMTTVHKNVATKSSLCEMCILYGMDVCYLCGIIDRHK